MGNEPLKNAYNAEIMIVDDTTENLTLLNEIFKSEGYLVRSSNSGELALMSIEKKLPDIILLDIKMPDLDGFEVCKRLKADKKTSDIPIIFITAIGETQDKIEAFNLGAVDFITKPFDRQEVIARVRVHINFRIQQLQLQESEERFRFAQEMSPDGFTILRPVRNEIGETIDFIWVYENQAIARINQTDPQNIIGKRLLDLFPEHSGTSIFDTYINVANTGESQIIEEVYVGEVISKPTWLRLVAVSMSEDIAILAHDITERKKIEYELKQSEEKYRSIFDQSITGIYLHDLEGRILDVNKAACLQSQYAKDELLNLNVFDLHPRKADTVNLSNEEILRRWNQFQLGQQNVFDGEHQRKDGIVIPVQISTGLILYQNKKRIMAMVQDISERKQAEKALAHSHDLMRYIIEHNRGAVSVFDKDLKFLYVSKRYIDDCMIKEDNIIGKYNYEVFPDFPQKWREAHQKALKGEITREERDSYERDDGSFEWICWECRPWYEFDGSVGGIVVYTEIITDRIKLLEDFKKKEYNLRLAQEIAHVGSFDYDMTSDKLVCSDEGLNICGITQKEFSGKADAIIQFIHPEEREYALQISFNAITEKKVNRAELRIIRQDGEERIIDFRVGPVFDGNGNCVSTTGTIQDITERKRAEENLIYINNHDHLTGLYNRRYFEEKLTGLDVECNLPLSIIMLDTNGLKIINDSFGHEMGDELLKKSASVIKQACRTEDLIVRFGGDEFVVVLPNTNTDETLKVATSIKELALKERVANIELSISYGYATKHLTSESIMEILANAENHMYSHKLSERSSMRSKQIEIIMNTLFEKSPRESQHSIRVSKICEAIAKKMNFEEQAVNHMRVAGLVHDIGKIGTDEKILNKNGKLDSDEWNEMQKHPEAGWRILSSSNEFVKLAQFVLNHHEKWDGSGYPNGLKGENIPLEARIITMADAYDAMTSERSYRKALDKDKAIEELKRCSGTQFDPAIVDIFVNQVAPNIDFSRS